MTDRQGKWIAAVICALLAFGCERVIDTSPAVKHCDDLCHEQTQNDQDDSWPY